MFLTLSILLLFQGPTIGVPLMTSCAEDATVLAALAPSAAVEVRSSRVDGAETCYGVSTKSDKPVRGYVRGSVLDAIKEYDDRRFKVIVPPPPAPASETKPAMNPADPAPKPPSGPPFANFAALDTEGRRIILKDIHANVVVVCFWAPYNRASQMELLSVTGLSNLYKRKGVEAVGIVLSGDRAKLDDTLEDFATGMPNIPNIPGGNELAARYGVTSANLPQTFVLNKKHEVIASGLHGKALEMAIRRLADPK